MGYWNLTILMTARRSVIVQMDGFFLHLSAEFLCGCLFDEFFVEFKSVIGVWLCLPLKNSTLTTKRSR
jgi:hypothetical protein